MYLLRIRDAWLDFLFWDKKFITVESIFTDRFVPVNTDCEMLVVGLALTLTNKSLFNAAQVSPVGTRGL